MSKHTLNINELVRDLLDVRDVNIATAAVLATPLTATPSDPREPRNPTFADLLPFIREPEGETIDLLDGQSAVAWDSCMYPLVWHGPVSDVHCSRYMIMPRAPE
jgi:hypothetical protein